MAMLYDVGAATRNEPTAFQSTNGDGHGPRKFDPAAGVPGAPPNFGQFIAPHVVTFTGTVSSLAKVYRPSDEALRDSAENARFMRNDLVVMECVEHRQRATALLNWHIEADDEKNPGQKELAGTLTKMCQRIPRFMQYRENLQHATWFGKYGVANRWRWKVVGGRNRISVDRWRPVHGDKLVWRYDPDDPRWDEDQIGIRVGIAHQGSLVGGKWPVEKASQVEATDLGLAYFLRPWERTLLSIHKHYIEDGEYESPEYAGRIHGVGIRSRIYWTWFQKQETLAWLMEYLERSAGGFEVWFYPWGNDAARQEVEKAARERMSMGRNQILVPKFLENDSFGQWYDRIEPSMAGAEALKSIIVEYFGHLIKRYILGQTLTTEASNTGMGSNQADIHLGTFFSIVKYDATLLEETITTELIEPMIRYNFPWAVNIPFAFKIDTESDNAKEKLEAWNSAYQMGLKLKAQEVYDLIGATKPAIGDEVLDQSAQQQAGAMMGGMPGQGMPGQGGAAEGSQPNGQFEGASGTQSLDGVQDGGSPAGGNGQPAPASGGKDDYSAERFKDAFRRHRRAA
jgi:phage gp29-like protein